MHEQSPDELFWTAAQYAAGDLPDEAVVEFEARMETDQTAREALAQAVALSEAVRQAEATPVVPVGVDSIGVVGSRRTSTIFWVAVATAACLALAFTYSTWRPAVGPQGGDVAHAAPTDAQRRLAEAWVAGQSDSVAAVVDDALLAAALLGDDAEDDFVLPQVNVEPSAPDWLIAALADAENLPTRGEN